MNFDIKKVYTAATADQLKPGDKVYVGNTIAQLKEAVEKGMIPQVLSKIEKEDEKARFCVEMPLMLLPGSIEGSSLLAYLVESAPGKTEEAPKRATSKEVIRWLAEGKGLFRNEILGRPFYGTDLPVVGAQLDGPALEGVMIRRWDDTEWHEPTVGYINGTEEQQNDKKEA